MIETIATLDIINLAIKQIEDGKVNDAKQGLSTYSDKLQKEVNEFDKWATNQSNIEELIQLEIDSELGK